MKFVCYVLCIVSAIGSGKNIVAGDFQVPEKKLTLLGNIVVGGTVGAAEVIMPGQILTYAMNSAIKGTPFILQDSYKGFVANAVGQMPITAMQKLTQAFGIRTVENRQGAEASDMQKMAISSAAGIAGAVIDTPCNAVQLYLQDMRNKGKSIRAAMKELGSRSFRGFVPNALMKEAPFAVGYQVLAPRGQQIVQKYVDDERVATVVGGTIAGIVTAVVTHPGAVMRNLMQGDLNAEKYKTTIQTMRTIYQQKGCSGFFDGFKARGSRVAIAIPLYAAYTKMVENYIVNRSEGTKS